MVSHLLKFPVGKRQRLSLPYLGGAGASFSPLLFTCYSSPMNCHTWGPVRPSTLHQIISSLRVVNGLVVSLTFIEWFHAKWIILFLLRSLETQPRLLLSIRPWFPLAQNPSKASHNLTRDNIILCSAWSILSFPRSSLPICLLVSHPVKLCVPSDS